MNHTPSLRESRPEPPSGLARKGGGGLRLLLVAVLLLPLVACATKRDVRDLQEEMHELAARQDSVLRNLERLQRETQESVVAQSGAIQDFRTQIARQILELEDQLLVVQELAGQSQRGLAQLRDQLEARRAELLAPPPGGDREDDDPWGGAVASGDGQAEELFNTAITQYNRRNFTAARMGFEELVSGHPNSPLTPRARYYLASIKAEQGDIEEAIEAFLEIRQYHPGADAVPEALLRVGLLYLDEMDDQEEAREYFERVVESYPDSPAAEDARERLDALG